MTNETVYPASDIGTLYKNDERSIEQKYGNIIAPYFKIKVSDTDERVLFSAESLLEDGGYDLNGLIVDNVSFEEDIEGADSISFTVFNPDMNIHNTTIFTEGNNIDIFMGYDGRTPFFMGRGIIIELDTEFLTDSIPTMRVIAYDKSYFMMEEGRAEIVPEGSSWWQRRSRRSGSPRSTRNDTNVTNSSTSTDPSMRDYNLAVERSFEIDALEEVLERSIDDGIHPEYPLSGNQNASDSDGNQRTRTWQRQRFGRRRRRAGKVWKGKTDSEIVAAIFRSYGITPYVEATRERGRRVTNRNRPRTQIDRNAFGVESEMEQAESEEERRQVWLESLTVEERQELERARSPDAYYEEQTRIGNHTLQESYGSDYVAYNPDARENETIGVNQIRYATPEEDNNIARRMDDADLGMENIDHIDWRIGFNQNSHEVRLENLNEDNTTPPTQPSNSRTGSGTTERSVTQKAETNDWEFIKKLAESHGFILFVFFHIQSMRWIGYWGPEENVPQFRLYNFKYNDGDNSTLGRVRPNISMKNQSSEIDLLYIDPVTRQENRLRIAMENVNSQFREFNDVQGVSRQEPIGNGPEVVLTIHGQRVRVNASHRFRNAEEAKEWLISYWLAHAKDFYIIEGDTLVGIPEMRAKEYHYISGIGRYDGKFFITQVTHNMSSGNIYSTSFVGRKALDMRANEDPGDDILVVDQQILGEGQPGEIESSEVGLNENPIIDEL